MTEQQATTITRLSHVAGHFHWADLRTPDVDAACAFFGDLLGWTFEDVGGDGPNRYVVASVDGRTKAAIAGAADGDVQQAVWRSYLTVDDVDASTDRTRDLGGRVRTEPTDVLEMGRMSVVEDPTGAVLGLWADAQPGATTVKDEPGSVFWYELHTRDVDAACAFYDDLVGWSTDALQMGADFTYHLISPRSPENAQDRVGGLMQQMQADRDAGAPSQWFPYLSVEDCDDAWRRALDLGAGGVMEPHDIPTAGRACWITDPTGAHVALMTPDPTF